jgi:hypothetical protein
VSGQAVGPATGRTARDVTLWASGSSARRARRRCVGWRPTLRTVARGMVGGNRQGRQVRQGRKGARRAAGADADAAAARQAAARIRGRSGSELSKSGARRQVRFMRPLVSSVYYWRGWLIPSGKFLRIAEIREPARPPAPCSSWENRTMRALAAGPLSHPSDLSAECADDRRWDNSNCQLRSSAQSVDESPHLFRRVLIADE